MSISSDINLIQNKVFLLQKGTKIYHSSFSKYIEPLHQIQWFSSNKNDVKSFISNRKLGRIYSYYVDEDICLFDNSDEKLTYSLVRQGIIPEKCLIRGRMSVLDICSESIHTIRTHKKYPEDLEEYQKNILNLLHNYDGILDVKIDNSISFVLFKPNKITYDKLEFENNQFNIVRQISTYNEYKDVPKFLWNTFVFIALDNNTYPLVYFDYIKNNIDKLRE